MKIKLEVTEERFKEIAMLKSASFENVNCIYSNLKFGVVMAIK